MSELFLELFSEEIPPKLQIVARENLLNSFTNLFNQENIKYNKIFSALSTPNRLIIYFKDVQDEIIKEAKEIKGPNINSPNSALKGFIESNKILRSKIFKKKRKKENFIFTGLWKKKLIQKIYLNRIYLIYY